MIFEVIVDISNSNTDRVFDYFGEDFFCVGQRVLVPFGNRDIEGFIVGKKEHSDLDSSKIKSIRFALDEYVTLTDEMLQLARYMCKQYNLRLVDVLRLFIPAQMRGGRVKEIYYRQATLTDGMTVEGILKQLGKNAKSQRALIEYLHANGSTATAQLNKLFPSALTPLVKNGYVEINLMQKTRTPYNQLPQGNTVHHTLTTQQQQAYDTIMSNRQGSYLLFGVTGSGKTEVYLNIITQVVAEGKTAIMLVPEISLTPSVLKLFRTRFGNSVAILHSGLSAGERFDEWQRLKRGEANIAIGARSAIFAPIDNIGVIIIDEQHDSSYISQTNPRYDTIDIAEKRREYNNCTLVMGSATPSVDTFYQAQQGKYQLITLPDRINRQPLPKVEIVDMCAEVRAGNKEIFSTLLKTELDDCLNKGNQAMIFLNRRGYSSFVMCTKCGYVAKCTDCDISLTYHADDNQLKCHYCGKRFKMLDICPNCKNTFLRQGRVGTEQVVKYLNTMYPNVKVLRMDYDTTQTKEAHCKILESFSNRQAQILVGTQMIAKGHDFPYVTLVGVLEGDQSLYYSDYLACERTFQLLTQVAGRSGRDRQAGKVVLQTYTPNHYCLQMSAQQDYLAFYKREINLRQATSFPPFAEVVRIVYSGLDSEKCVKLLNKHYAQIEELRQSNEQAFLFLQRMRCPLKRVERKHRYQILMRLDSQYIDILQRIYAICNQGDKEVSVFCERNPQNMN
ncbi:MAG: primosomal protein N' [Clostridia bacterium]|nr:primosomal protein N' [Clostridia bacterium]